MSVHEGPYIPADQEPKELTIRVLVVESYLEFS